jgi:hypothetical protein
MYWNPAVVLFLAAMLAGLLTRAARTAGAVSWDGLMVVWILILVFMGWYTSRAEKRLFLAFLANLLEAETTHISLN